MENLPRIALAQINPTVGDLDGNAALIADWSARAVDAGARLVAFPELSLTGYPAEDLYLRPDFIAANRRVLEQLARQSRDWQGAGILVGFAQAAGRAGTTAIAHNSAALLRDGRIEAIYNKRLLPNYGVFDEYRTFRNGEDPLIIEVDGNRVGLTICEDCWVADSPVADDLAPGADLIVNLSASPYYRGKASEREDLFRQVAIRESCPVAMVNAVGGQDELVFDGASVVIGPDGAIIDRAPQFTESLLVCEPDGSSQSSVQLPGWMDDTDEVYTCLVTGLRDYTVKNGFTHVGLGLSGGVDSALVAALATDALGPEQVTCVVMPSPHSSSETQADARSMAAKLGLEIIEYDIAPVMGVYDDLLGDDATGLAAENLQARIRGNLIMALSNHRGWLILATANKSETSVGYSTLYGDMAGGLAPIQDVPKTLVYGLCRHRNRISPVIPESILNRPPSAELRPEQQDSDSLPGYDQLDRILKAYIELDQGPAEIAAGGEDPAVVADVIALVDRAEYKRRQAAPGLKVTTKGFGRDRRMPITNRYRPWRPA